MASREPNPGPNGHRDGNTYSKFIVKNVKNVKSGAILRPKDMALFVRELSILHHFRHHDGIVQLLGVGWSYDCLEDVDLTPCPKPALLLEEAQGTLEWLLAQPLNVTLLVEMKICSDIASGLLALHECGLMHGDVKPANILVFPQPVIRDGVESLSYGCKISDFSLTRVVGAEDSWFSGGTRLYIAPEQGSKLSPEQLLRTDVWSLGLLFAQVTQRELDLKQAIGKPELMAKIIHQSVHDSIQSSTWDSVTTTLWLSMVNDTVQKDANKRHLHRVVHNFQMYFQQKAQHLAIRPIKTITPRFEPIKQNDLLLSYENFKYTSRHVHDTIVARLQEVAQFEQDPRRPQALFELAVIALSDYAGPLFTPQEGLAMLRKSAELGYVRAQVCFTPVQKALEPHREVSPHAQEWLENAAPLNHTIAGEYLRVLHSPRAMASATSSTAVPIVEEHSPEHLDARDANGNTPLILASRDGDHSAIVRLLDAVPTRPLQTMQTRTCYILCGASPKPRGST